MPYDIYGNNLREGFCEVHPHVKEYYPCSICYDEIQKEEDRRRENDQQKEDYYKTMEQEYYKPMETVPESIFIGLTTIIPMSDVQHIEKHWRTSDKKTRDNYIGIKIITKHTRWDIEDDFWANNIYLDRQEGDDFLKKWYVYRNELETESLIQKHKK